MLCFYAPTAWALDIATGPSDGSYFQIAQDIKNVAGKDGIDLQVMATKGSLENLELLGGGKVDLAIVQLDALKFMSDVVKQDLGLNLFEKIKVVMNLYPEEIHILTNKKDIQTFYNLEGKRVSVGPPGGGTAVTAAVLFNVYDIKATVSEEPFEDAVKKMEQGSLDAVIFVGGAPVPFIEKLGGKFSFVGFPPIRCWNRSICGLHWASNSMAGPGPTRRLMECLRRSWVWTKRDEKYVTEVQQLVLTILNNRDFLETQGYLSGRARSFEPTFPIEAMNRPIR